MRPFRQAALPPPAHNPLPVLHCLAPPAASQAAPFGFQHSGPAPPSPAPAHASSPVNSRGSPAPFLESCPRRHAALPLAPSPARLGCPAPATLPPARWPRWRPPVYTAPPNMRVPCHRPPCPGCLPGVPDTRLPNSHARRGPPVPGPNPLGEAPPRPAPQACPRTYVRQHRCTALHAHAVRCAVTGNALRVRAWRGQRAGLVAAAQV